MEKIWLMVLGTFFFTTLCFAQNYYALVEVVIKNDAGLTFIMNTTTKVAEEQACQKLLLPIDLLKSQYQVRTECVAGQKWDKLFADTFADKPTSSLYISYKDPNGYETRINTKVLAGSDSSPGGVLPVNPPENETLAWAVAMVTALEKGGIRNPKIIYPQRNK